MNTEEKANELYPNNKTFCGGVAHIARDAFAKGARMQKEVDDKELSEKVSAAYQLGLSDREKQMMAGAFDGEVVQDINGGLAVTSANVNLDGFKFGDKVKIIIVKEEKNGTE
jgi:hypothetical protein